MPEICEGGPQVHGRGLPHKASQGAGRAAGEYAQHQFPQAPRFKKGLGQHEKLCKNMSFLKIYEGKINRRFFYGVF
jgi:hypothetical protein